MPNLFSKLETRGISLKAKSNCSRKSAASVCPVVKGSEIPGNYI